MRFRYPLLLATVFSLAAAQTSFAADLPAKMPVYKAPIPAVSSWTGFYAGFNAGWGWSKAASTATPFGATAIADFAPMSVSDTAQGALFGGQLGYNWQFGRVLLGVEGDFDGAGINESAATTTRSLSGGAGSTDGVMVHEKIDWLASVRGRIGYTFGPSLIYATGGAAFEQVQVNTLLSADTASGTFSQSGIGSFSTTKTGWVAGAGYEWMVAPSWTVRGEYLHYGFGSGPTNAVLIPGCARGPCGATVAIDKTNIDVVRLGVNYMFNGGGFNEARNALASAAPVLTVASWTGFYAGFNAGWGWSKAASTATPFGATAIADFASMSVSDTAQGALFGGQLGYNWQFGRVLLGIEGDFDGAGINGSAATTTVSLQGDRGSTDGVMVHEKIDWLASLRGRVGYTFGPALVYATGGAAWEHVKVNALLSADTATSVFAQSGIGSFSATKSGWVAGAGYEWMVAPRWTVRGEYLHYGFGSGPNNVMLIPGCDAGPCGATVSVSKTNVDAVRLGANYVFGGLR